jgi:hypothetical protein
VSPQEVVVTVLATDTIANMKTKVTNAIIAKGAEIGLTVTISEMILPAYSKG